MTAGRTSAGLALAAFMLAAFMLAAFMLAASGCVVTTMPNGKSQAHWAGNYDQAQAAQQDADRETALRIRQALAGDAALRSLHLRYFVSHGEVSLCGPFPNDKLRSRAVAVISVVKGVSGVDEDCHH